MCADTKKHPCPDCHHCQWCGDDRCRLCLKPVCHRKLSLAEQIELYERINQVGAGFSQTLPDGSKNR